MTELAVTCRASQPQYSTQHWHRQELEACELQSTLQWSVAQTSLAPDMLWKDAYLQKRALQQPRESELSTGTWV